MHKRYVLRKEGFEKVYRLDLIRPYEALYSAILGCRNDSFYYTDYDRVKNIDKLFLERLTPFEIKIILYRFGFTGEWYTLQQVGDMFNLSRERIRQVEEKALRKMRHPSFSRIIKPKYDINVDVPNPFGEIESEFPIKDSIISGIEKHIFSKEKDKIIQTIFERNNIAVFDSSKNPNLHYIDDCELSVRAYNVLKRAGIDTIEAFLKASQEDVYRIRNIGRRGLEELLDYAKNNNITSSPEMDEIIELSSKQNSADSRYVSYDVCFNGKKQSYKFVKMEEKELANCIYDIIINEFDYKHLIYNYEISMGLLYLLIIKGYLFVEKLVEDADIIRKELVAGGFTIYIEEFDSFVVNMSDMLTNKVNPIISFLKLDTTIAKNMIRKNVTNPTQASECCNLADEEENSITKEAIMMMCLMHSISIEINEPVKNNDYQEYLNVETDHILEEDSEERVGIDNNSIIKDNKEVFYKIKFTDTSSNNRIWLGRTRINYVPTFIETSENSMEIVIEKSMLQSDVLQSYLNGRKYELIEVSVDDITVRRIIRSESDWEN